MAFISKAYKEKEFDIRMVQRGLSKGLVLQADVEKHQKKLPDDAANAEFVSIEFLRESIGRKPTGLR